MNEFLFKAVLAGILFGIWPLFIGKSGLNGATAALLGGMFTFLFIAPFALASGVSVAGTRWWVAIITGAMAAVGCLAFNDVMVRAKEDKIALLFVVMLVVQTMMPVIYHIIMNQAISIRTIVGFAAAIVACILLSSK